MKKERKTCDTEKILKIQLRDGTKVRMKGKRNKPPAAYRRHSVKLFFLLFLPLFYFFFRRTFSFDSMQLRRFTRAHKKRSKFNRTLPLPERKCTREDGKKFLMKMEVRDSI
jgi:hypothetical protein